MAGFQHVCSTAAEFWPAVDRPRCGSWERVRAPPKMEGMIGCCQVDDTITRGRPHSHNTVDKHRLRQLAPNGNEHAATSASYSLCWKQPSALDVDCEQQPPKAGPPQQSLACRNTICHARHSMAAEQIALCIQIPLPYTMHV